MDQNNIEAPTGRAFAEEARRLIAGDLWPRARRCLELLTDQELWWRPNDQANSAGNLVLHMAGNLRQWIISGIGGAPDTRDRPREFSKRGPVPKADLIALMTRTVEEAGRALDQFDVRKLLEECTLQGFHVTRLQVIFHATEHFSHHTGQIIYITKQLKNKDMKFYDL